MQFPCPVFIGKIACGDFSDIGFVSAGKRRDFCRLLSAGRLRRSGGDFSDIGFVSGAKARLLPAVQRVEPVGLPAVFYYLC
jgi:hypothetical protein